MSYINRDGAAVNRISSYKSWAEFAETTKVVGEFMALAERRPLKLVGTVLAFDRINAVAEKAPDENNSPNLPVALNLASAGIAIFPCNELKKPLVKWRDASTTRAETIRFWFRTWPNALVGIDLAKTGLIVVDADRHDPTKDGVAALLALESENEPFDAHPIIRTPRNGYHHIFKQPDPPLGNATGALPPGIDIRGDGGYIIAAGCVTKTGAWVADDDAPDLVESYKADTIAELPVILKTLIATPKHRPDPEPAPQAAAVAPSSLPGTRERAFAETALEGNCNELAGAFEGERNTKLNALAYRMGRMVARHWIAQAVVESKLYQAADACGLLKSDGRRQVLATIASGLKGGLADPHPDLAADDAVAVKTEWVDEDGVVHESYAPKGLLSTAWDGDDPLEFPDCLVEDLITEKTTGWIAGESQAGKTFIALDLAFALALGQPFFGKATKRGGVIYVAAEAPGTIPARKKAIREHRAYPLVFNDSLTLHQANNLPIVTVQDVPDLATEKGIGQLIDTAKHIATEVQHRYGIPLRLIIIDTAIAAFQIKSWFDPADVSKVTRAMARLGRETDAAVLAIGHHGKDIAKGLAMSFAGKANADTVLTVLMNFMDDDPLSGNVATRHISLTKWRDGPTGWQSEFKLESVKVGLKADGTDVYSAYVSPVEDGMRIGYPKKDKKDKAVRPDVRAFREAFTEAIIASGEQVQVQGDGPSVKAVRREAVRKAFDARYVSDAKDQKEAHRKAFERGLEAAIADWRIHQGQWSGAKWIWQIEPGQKGQK